MDGHPPPLRYDRMTVGCSAASRRFVRSGVSIPHQFARLTYCSVPWGSGPCPRHGRAAVLAQGPDREPSPGRQASAARLSKPCETAS
jgi:hypothetical protein